MARIFISYSRADRQFIDQFAPLIRRVYDNNSVWFDDDIHGGVDWWQMILDEIENCDIFVYLISNESLESPYCQAEFREALRLKKHILPIIVRRLKPPYPGNIEADLAEVLHRTHYIDMSGGFRNEENNVRIWGAINRLMAVSQFVIPITSPPTAEPPVPDKKKSDSNISVAYISGGFVLVAAIIAGIFGLWQGYFSNQPIPTPPATAIVAQQSTETPIAFRPQNNNDWTPVEQDFDGVTMVLVPAGCFDMGDNGAGGRQCFNESFWIDKYEVTQGQFARFGGAKANDNRFSGDERPVERITWFEARDFCALRVSRLPTEAEWEYAARGPDNLVYPWGNTWYAYNAVWGRSSLQGTVDVGIRTGVSWVGALDMIGNVAEWTSSLYTSYPYNATDGREADTGSRTDVSRGLRGGSWSNYDSDFLRAPARNGNHPNFRSNNYGFRCARDLD